MTRLHEMKPGIRLTTIDQAMDQLGTTPEEASALAAGYMKALEPIVQRRMQDTGETMEQARAHLLTWPTPEVEEVCYRLGMAVLENSRERAVTALRAAAPPADIEAIYHCPGGPTPIVLRARRAEIDAALLDAQAAGVGITTLVAVLGLSESTIDLALHRARESRI